MDLSARAVVILDSVLRCSMVGTGRYMTISSWKASTRELTAS